MINKSQTENENTIEEKDSLSYSKSKTSTIFFD